MILLTEADMQSCKDSSIAPSNMLNPEWTSLHGITALIAIVFFLLLLFFGLQSILNKV